MHLTFKTGAGDEADFHLLLYCTSDGKQNDIQVSKLNVNMDAEAGGDGSKRDRGVSVNNAKISKK